MNLRQWKRDIHCKILALWHILTNRVVVCGLYFDTDHPLNIAPQNQSEDVLITLCIFDGPGALQDESEMTLGGYNIARLREIYHQEKTR